MQTLNPNQKLVEAAKYTVLTGEGLTELDLAVQEASAPQKEFAGMDKEGWDNLTQYLYNAGRYKEWEACRQIAEGLHE